MSCRKLGGEGRRRDAGGIRGRVAAEVGVEAAGSGEFVASGQISPGGLPWWGRRGAPGIAAAELLLRLRGVRRRDSVRRLGLAGAVVDGRWGAGEGQGTFKKGRPASACGSGRRSRRGRCALDWVRS